MIMAQQAFWGETTPDGTPNGFGVMVQHSIRTITETYHRSYEEVMSTAEFDSCGRVINTIPGYYTEDRKEEEWFVLEIGWWKDGRLEKRWTINGKPWTSYMLHHRKTTDFGDEDYKVRLSDSLVHQKMKESYYTLYYSIIGAGKDYLEIETGSTKNHRVHDVFKIGLDGTGGWEKQGGSYHHIHKVWLEPIS